MSRNTSSTKWWLHWGSFRGSSLNLRWIKCGVSWVDQWVPISWLHIESSWYHWTHAWLLYSFGILTCWLCWFNILIEDSNVTIFLYFIAIPIQIIDTLIVLIDYLVCLSIVTLILSWLFYSSHMYRLIVVYFSTWCVDHFSCILSWLLWSMLSLPNIHLD